MNRVDRGESHECMATGNCDFSQDSTAVKASLLLREKRNGHPPITQKCAALRSHEFTMIIFWIGQCFMALSLPTSNAGVSLIGDDDALFKDLIMVLDTDDDGLLSLRSYVKERGKKISRIWAARNVESAIRVETKKENGKKNEPRLINIHPSHSHAEENESR